MASDWAMDSALPTQSSTTSAPPDSVAVAPDGPAERHGAGVAAHGPGQLVGREDLGGAELAGQPLLVRVAGADQHDRRRGAATGRGQVGQRGGHQQPERAGAEDGHHVARGDGRAEHRVHRAGHGLHRDRVGVAERRRALA